MTSRFFVLLAALGCCLSLLAAAPFDHAERIASLIDPAKLATLRQRGANPRVQKAVYWLEVARKEGQAPEKVLDRAVALAGYAEPAAAMTKAALLRNLDIARRLGCLDEAGLAEMRRGNAAGIDAHADEREEERQHWRPAAGHG
jgi:hypothetical protein